MNEGDLYPLINLGRCEPNPTRRSERVSQILNELVKGG